MKQFLVFLVCLTSLTLQSQDVKQTAKGVLKISSNPIGATILVDGKDSKMKTPLEERFPVGPMKITLRLRNYKDSTFTVIIQTVTPAICDIPLVRTTFTLHLKTIPPGAKGTIDSMDPIVTDTTLELLSGEKKLIEHYIDLEMEGFEKELKRVSGKAGSIQNITITLKSTFGYLTVNAEANAQVFLSDKPMTLPVENYHLEPGQYTLKVKEDSKEDSIEIFEIKAGQTIIRTPVLKSKYGTLDVTSFLSDIYIDGEKKGTGKFTGKLPNATYTVSATRKDYDTVRQTVKVSSEIPARVTLTPNRIIGTIYFVSQDNPETKGAKIYINDQDSGRIPKTVKLPPGSYRIRLEKQGLNDLMDSIQITATRVMTFDRQMKRETPKNSYGSLEIIADSCDIRIGNEKKATGKFFAAKILTGTYSVKAERYGYFPDTAFVTVTSGMPAKKVLVPVKIYALVDFTAKQNPQSTGALIFINDQDSGQVPRTVKLPYGQHKIRLSKEGFTDLKDNIVINSQEKSEFDANMIAVPPKVEPKTEPKAVSRIDAKSKNKAATKEEAKSQADKLDNSSSRDNGNKGIWKTATWVTGSAAALSAGYSVVAYRVLYKDAADYKSSIFYHKSSNAALVAAGGLAAVSVACLIRTLTIKSNRNPKQGISFIPGPDGIGLGVAINLNRK